MISTLKKIDKSNRNQFPNSKSNDKRKMLLGFLIPYLLVLVIPALTGALLYGLSAKTMQNQADRTNMLRLQDTESVTSQQIGSMINYAERIALNKSITSLSSMPERRPNSTDILKIKESSDSLKNFGISNPLITEIYVHFFNSGVTLSSTDVFLNFDRFYGTYFQWGDMNTQSFLHKTSATRFEKMILPTQEMLIKTTSTSTKSNALLYLQSLPLEFHSQNEGFIFIAVNENELQRLLSGVELGDAGQAMIIDSSQNIVSNVSAENAPKKLFQSLPELPAAYRGNFIYKFLGKRYSVTYVKSSLYGWTYLSAIPTSFVYEQMWQLGIVVITIFIVTLILGVVLAICLSKRNAKPWQDMAYAMSINECNETDHLRYKPESIRKNVIQVVEKNKNMESLLVTQLPVMQASFFIRLFLGKFSTQQQLDREMLLTKLQLQNSVYLVLVIDLNKERTAIETSFNKKTTIKTSFQEMMQHQLDIPVYSLDDLEDESITFLLLFSEKYDSLLIHDFRNVLKDWHCEMREKYHLYIKTVGGQFKTNLYDVNHSFNEARQVLSYANYQEPMFFEDLPKGVIPYFYPFEFENQIIHQVWAGNEVAVIHLFDQLRQENLVNQTLSPTLSNLLASEICGTLIHILDRSTYDVPLLLQNIQDLTNQDLTYVIECAQLICLSMTKKSKESQTKKKDDLDIAVILYLHEKYADPCLCIANIKDNFLMTQNAINTLFIEKTGKTFSAYLESYRMEMACEMLKNRRCSIQEVSEAVGYTSSHSFRRAFKRMYNIVPTDFQSENIENNEIEMIHL